MSDKTKTEGIPTAKTKNSKIEDMRKRARPVSNFTEEWKGDGPLDIDPDLTPDRVEKLEIEDLFGKPVMVTGYSLRDGNKGEFVIVCLVPDETGKVSTMVTGGVAVVRKMKAVGDKGGFPVVGKFIQPEGKQYFDFVSAE